MTDQRRRVKQGYDQLAAHFQDERSGSTEDEVITELVGRLPAGARVLDAGCGDGRPVAVGLESVFDVVGLDFSRAQLRVASTRLDDTTLVLGDMTELPFAGASFDAVTAVHSLIHVPSDAHEQTLAEFARVLQWGGLLVVSVGDEPWEGANPDWLESGVAMRWSVPGREAVETALDELGFSVVDRYRVPDSLDEDSGSWPFLLAKLEG